MSPALRSVVVLLGVVGLLVGGGAALADIDRTAAATVETAPGQNAGDSIDDPAIWVHPGNPGRSLVIGNDKQGALETYDLQGSRLQRVTDGGGFFGNVDVRQGVTIGGVTRDIVAVAHNGVTFFEVNAANRRLVEITDGARAGGSGEGLCLVHDRGSGSLFVVQVDRQGRLRQFAVEDPDLDGLVSTRQVRAFAVGSEVEGCVANDATGDLFLAEEDVAIWQYGMLPASGTSRSAVARIEKGSPLAADIEGLALAVNSTGQGFLVASSQNLAAPNDSYFTILAATGAHAFAANVRVTGGTAADDCDRTDGIAAYAGALGTAFPQGIFVCQDNINNAPGGAGNQNFKLVPWQRMLG